MTLEFAEWTHSLVDADVNHALDSVRWIGRRLVPELELALFKICLIRDYLCIAPLLALVL